MYLLNFSIDNISLLGLTLAVGLVVDDAIVMLENIYRHMEEDGLEPFEAALKGSREIGFTIMSITVSLVAVFIPVLLMGGIIGRIFNEFAVVVTVAIVASAFVSLTLTPMLAAKILRKPEKDERQAAWSVLFERGFDASLRGYDRTLKFCLRHQPLMLAVFLATLAGHGLARDRDTQGLLPAGGYRPALGLDRGPAGYLLPGDGGIAAAGRGRASALAPCRQRRLDRRLDGSKLGPQQRPPVRRAQAARPAPGAAKGACRPAARHRAAFPASAAYATPVQNLRIGGRSSRAEYQFVMQSLDRPQLYEWSQKMADAMGRDPHFADVNSDLQINATQATLIVDKDKASSLGISAEQLRSTLYSGFGSRQISTIYGTGDSFSVVMEFTDKTNWTTAELPDVRIRNSTRQAGADRRFRAHRAHRGLAHHQSAWAAARGHPFVQPAAGRALGDAVARIEQLKAELKVPPTVTTDLRRQRQDLPGLAGQSGHPADRPRW